MADSKVVTTKQLTELWGVSAAVVKDWKAAGMPLASGYKSRFDLGEARAWAVMHGYLSPAECDIEVCQTLDELRIRLNYSSSWRCRQWVREPNFPGRSKRSVPGAQYSYLPVPDILAWLKVSHPFNTVNGRAQGTLETDDGEAIGQIQAMMPSSNASREELSNVKLEREKIKLAKEAGDVIDCDTVHRFIERYSSYCITVLESLPGRVDARLPEGLDPEMRSEIRSAAMGTVHDCRVIMADYFASRAAIAEDDNTVGTA
jgi:phage terminase Nu1 subunit (DNA packaging protein)